MRWFLRASLGVIALVIAGLGPALTQVASADTCRVTATLVGGGTASFTVNAAPGTPPADMVPPGLPPISSVSANCSTTANTRGSLTAGGATSHNSTPTKTTASRFSSSPGGGDTQTSGQASNPPTSKPTAVQTTPVVVQGTTARSPAKPKPHQPHASKKAPVTAPPAPATQPSQPSQHTHRRSSPSRPEPARSSKTTIPVIAASPASARQRLPASSPHRGSSSLPWLPVVAVLVLIGLGIATPLARRRRAQKLEAPEPARAPEMTDKVMPGPDLLLPDEVVVDAGTLRPSQPPTRAPIDVAHQSSLGVELESCGDIAGAIAAYRVADAAGDAAAATNLGVLLEHRGDLEGAMAAYRRADERGDGNGSFNLGCLLADSGDVAGAVAALRRADDRGDPAAASNLGVLLEQEGDLEGALAAYQRADERGDASGSFNLGLLLASFADWPGAAEAYRRAGEGNDPAVAEQARAALGELQAHASR